MPLDEHDIDGETAEIRMIDYPNTQMPEGEYHIIIVRIERENGRLIVYARFADLGRMN